MILQNKRDASDWLTPHFSKMVDCCTKLCWSNRQIAGWFDLGPLGWLGFSNMPILGYEDYWWFKTGSFITAPCFWLDLEYEQFI